VVDADRRVVGTVATSDIVHGYRRGLLAGLRQALTPAGGGGPDEVEVEVMSGSRWEGTPIRRTDLPAGALVMSIQRREDLIVPVGDTVLEAGDRLALVGTPIQDRGDWMAGGAAPP
jgi:TrkA-C domain